MVTIDIIGMIISIIFIGIRYPHIALIAVLAHEAGKILMAVFVHQQIDLIISAGAFGTASFVNHNSGYSALVMFSGALANFVLASMLGGIEYEKMTHLLNPIASLSSPWAVINLRLALLSFTIIIWNFL